MTSLYAKIINYVLLPLSGTKKLLSNTENYDDIFSVEDKSCPPPKKLLNLFDIHLDKIHTGLKYYHITKKQKYSKKLIVYIHGGAYVKNLSKNSWKIIENLMNSADVEVIAPLYSLAPQNTWQTAFQQLQNLYKELTIIYSNHDIIFSGDSAGGGLALAFTQMLRDDNYLLPEGLILFSPWLDVSMTDPYLMDLADKDKLLAIPGVKWAGEKWAGDIETKDPRVSPIYGSMENLPPIALFTGTADILYADAKRLKDRTIQENLNIQFFEYPNLFHVWVASPITEARTAFLQVSNFIKSL